MAAKKEEGKMDEEKITNKSSAKKTPKKKSIRRDKKTEKIAELEKDLEESKDKYLRLYAEFENYKKRTVKERIDLMKNAAQDTLSSLLPVLDDFDRAKISADDENTDESFSDGVNMIYNKLHSTLQSKGLKAMESTGHDFDAEVHEALTEIPAPSDDLKGKVIDTIEKGYKLNDKIIRYAKVVVGK